jgi:response regulator RpfG family c-di-GMP phosphodiesterase
MSAKLAPPMETARRVLVVDDEEVIVLALRELLVEAGYDVLTASDPRNALEQLERLRVGVIVSDHKMPGMTGLEFLACARELQPDATRILITGLASLELLIGAINKGEIYRFIVKPWIREEFLATVSGASQRHELLRRNAALQAATMAMNEKLARLNEDLQKQLAREADQARQLARLNDALAQDLGRSVELGAQILQTFNPALGHQARVAAQVAGAMAAALELDAVTRRQFEMSAWLHDLGLLGVPRRLIRRWQTAPDELTAEERGLIEQHPVLGQALVGVEGDLAAVGAAIRAHHERCDGSGFPDRLAGERIPRLGRWLAVAAFYAGAAYDPQAAADCICERRGSWFDPEAVDAFVRAWRTLPPPPELREVPLEGLRPGMVLASDVRAGNGLLLPAGQRLSAPYIDILLNQPGAAANRPKLAVYC